MVELDKFIEPIAEKGPLVGVDIGKNFLKIAILGLAEKGFELEDFLLADMSLIDEKDRKEYARQALSGFMKGKNIYTGTGFYLLGEEETFSARLSMPNMPLSDLKKSAVWEAKESMPFNPENAMTDIHKIGDSQGADGSKKTDIIFMAADNKAVTNAISFFQANSLSPENINSAPGALINIINYTKKIDQDKPVAFLDIGYRHTGLYIFKEKKLIFTRLLSLGIEDLIKSLTGGVSTQTGIIQLSYEEAKAIISEHGMPTEDQLIGTTGVGIDSRRLLSMMRPVLEGLIDDITNSFSYLADKLGGEPVAKAYLIGGGAKLKNIDKFLFKKLNLQTEIFDLESIVSLSANITPEKKQDLPYFIALVGSMLGEGEGINFLPFEFRKRRAEIVQKITLRMTTFTIAMVLLLLYTFTSLRVVDYGKRAKLMEIHKDSMQLLKASKDEIKRVEAIISGLRQSRVDGTVILRELSNRTGKNIFLNDINYIESESQLQLKGIVSADDDRSGAILSEYIKSLENSRLFETVTLVSSARTAQAGEPAVFFDIKCKIEGQAPKNENK